MPTVFILQGFRFFFYSNENNEPVHVHIEKGNAAGKIWLEPGISIAYMYGFSEREVQQIMVIVHSELKTLKQKWNEYFA
jgi:hypothetical protein